MGGYDRGATQQLILIVACNYQFALDLVNYHIYACEHMLGNTPWSAVSYDQKVCSGGPDTGKGCQLCMFGLGGGANGKGLAATCCDP